MTTTATNRGAYYLVTTGITTSTDVRFGLLVATAGGSTTLASLLSVAQTYDLNTVADLTGHTGVDECSAGGYGRIALAGEAASEDDTNNWALLDANDVDFGTLAIGQSLIGMFAFVHTGSDATATLLYVSDTGFTTPIPTNGGTFSITTPNGYLQIVPASV